MYTNLIKAKIAELKLTNREVAEKIGINEQTLSNWINNKNIDRITKFIELLDFLGIEINDIKKD